MTLLCCICHLIPHPGAITKLPQTWLPYDSKLLQIILLAPEIYFIFILHVVHFLGRHTAFDIQTHYLGTSFRMKKVSGGSLVMNVGTLSRNN